MEAQPEADRGPGREWAVLALASLGAAVAAFLVASEKHPSPWYLTLAIVTAVAIFLLSTGALLVPPLLRTGSERVVRRRESAAKQSQQH